MSQVQSQLSTRRLRLTCNFGIFEQQINSEKAQNSSQPALKFKWGRAHWNVFGFNNWYASAILLFFIYSYEWENSVCYFFITKLVQFLEFFLVSCIVEQPIAFPWEENEKIISRIIWFGRIVNVFNFRRLKIFRIINNRCLFLESISHLSVLHSELWTTYRLKASWVFEISSALVEGYLLSKWYIMENYIITYIKRKNLVLRVDL